MIVSPVVLVVVFMIIPFVLFGQLVGKWTFKFYASSLDTNWLKNKDKRYGGTSIYQLGGSNSSSNSRDKKPEKTAVEIQKEAMETEMERISKAEDYGRTVGMYAGWIGYFVIFFYSRKYFLNL